MEAAILQLFEEFCDIQNAKMFGNEVPNPNNIMYSKYRCHANAIFNLLWLQESSEYKHLDWSIECGSIQLCKKKGKKNKHFDFHTVFGVFRHDREITQQDILEVSPNYPEECSCHFWLKAGDLIVDNISELIRKNTYGQRKFFYDFPPDHDGLVYMLSTKEWTKRGVYYKSFPTSVQSSIKEYYIDKNIDLIRESYELFTRNFGSKIEIHTK